MKIDTHKKDNYVLIIINDHLWLYVSVYYLFGFLSGVSCFSKKLLRLNVNAYKRWVLLIYITNHTLKTLTPK